MAACSLSVDARVVVQHRVPLRPADGEFSVALYTEAPSAEGEGGKELSFSGYERQPVEFDKPTSGQAGHDQRNSRAVSFAGMGSHENLVGYIVILDAGGRVFAYGPAERRGGFAEGGEVALARTAVCLKF